MSMGCTPVFALWILFILMIFVQIAAMIVLKTIVNYSYKDYLEKVIFPIIRVVVLSFLFPYLLHHFMINGVTRFVLVVILAVITASVTTYCVGLSLSEKAILKTICRTLFKKK